METTREQRKWIASVRALPWIVLSLVVSAVASYGQNFNIPLLSLTNHNTSAFSNYNSTFQNFTPATSHIDTSFDTIATVNEDRSLNPATPGHVSKTDVHTLIPKRPDLRWFAHVVPWFGNGHTDIGLNSNTTNWVTNAINDMINRGFNGIIIDWYGSNRFEDFVTLKIQAYIDTLPANKFSMIIMVDHNLTGGTTTNNLVNQIAYVKKQYMSDPHYELEANGQPFLMFFGVATEVTNRYGPNGMDELKTECGGNMMWVEQRTGFINSAWENGVFNWADPYDTSGPPPANNPFNTNVIINDFGTIASHPTKMAFGAMCGSFNGTLTSNINWSDGKYLPSSNGLCLYQRAQLINANIPNNMTRMQWVTWDDWQEGSAAEPGIENNVHMSPLINSAGLLSWTITSGEPRAVDHFEIYASKDGVNAALLATLPTSVTQTNVSQLLFSPGNYSIYVDAIGLPCVRDHMSTPVNFVVNPQTLIPTDYSRSMKITFTGYNRGTAVSNFPVLVQLSTNLSGFDYSQFMSPTANDLRFTDSSGNVLNHEIDQWNTNGVSTVWVSVPVIASSADFITAYWGNRADTNTPSFTTNGATWNGDLGVFHLKENGFPYTDSTTQHPATTGVTPTQTASGEVGNGEAFSGTQYLVPTNAINLGNTFSLSAWVNVTNTANNIQCVWANKVGGATQNGVALFINKFQTADGQILLETGDGVGGGLTVSISSVVTAGAWHNIFASVDRTGSGTATLYVDGTNVTVSGGTVDTSFANNNVFNLGRYTDGSFPFNGIMDEAHIEPLRSADWVWASYMTVASNSVLATYGPATLTKVLDQDAFTSGMKLTTAGYTRSTTLTNFPLLVQFSTAISGFSYSQFQPGGTDLRFTDASGQILCNHQIDTWNTNGVSSVWVQVPSIFSSTNYVLAYWGNPALTNAASFTTNGATWSNYLGVFHLNEGGFPYADSTTLHPANSGVAPTPTLGEIGNGEAMNGTQYLVPTNAINLGNSFSLSAWVNVTNTANNIQCVWANKVGGGNSNGIALFINKFNTTDGQLLVETGDGVTAGGLTQSLSSIVTAGVWHHVFASVNRTGGTINLYVDGTDVTASGGTVNANFGNNMVFNLGRYTDNSWHFHGILDEARIEPLRSADWVWATWMNVASNSNFVSYPSVSAPAAIVHPIQPPRLQMSLGAGELLFNWPQQGGNFALYSTTNLTPPVQWSLVTNSTILSDGQTQVPAPTTSGTAVFYRLQSQSPPQ